MIFFVGALYTHCVWMLVSNVKKIFKISNFAYALQISTSYKVCRESRTPVLRYSETAEKVFEYGLPWVKQYSAGVKVFIDYSVMGLNFFTACVYIVFVANTFHEICNTLFGWTMNVRVYILIVMVPILFIGQIRYLKHLTPFSGLGFFFTSITLGIVLYFIFKDPLVIHDKPLVASITKWPYFFTTISFAMSAITLITSVEASMKHPEKFLGKPNVLLISGSTIILFYFTIGFFGFARFGSLTRGSITLNLPTDEWTGIIGQTLIGLSILFSFGLLFYVATEILFKKIEHRIRKSRKMKEIAIRTFAIFIMVGVCLAVPDVGLFISLVGAFFSAGLSIFMPAFLDTIFRQSHGGFGSLNWILWKNVLIMVYAFSIFSVGTFKSIKTIIDTYQ